MRYNAQTKNQNHTEGPLMFKIKIVSLSNLIAGLVAVLVGFTSSVAIIFQAASALGATPEEVSSWLLALGVGMGITCIGLSLYYRIPVLTAWSTPGAALLAASLPGVSLPEAIGAFVFSAALIFIAGITGIFEKFMNKIPRSLTAAILAGVLFHLGLNIFIAMKDQSVLIFSMLGIYILGKQCCPRFCIPLALMGGILIAAMKGLIHMHHLPLALSSPVFTLPVFSLPVLINIGIPLFIITMTSQNIPGISAIKASGYKPPTSALISWTGLVNFFLAPFGCFALNLAAITAAICLNKEADLDPHKRYKAAMCAGVFYLIAGLLGASVVALFAILPRDLIWAIAGLALLSTIGNSLKIALEENAEREPALITFLITASGTSILGIGSAFLGLIVGIVVLMIFRLIQLNKAKSI